jgi:hypothetical protein
MEAPDSGDGFGSFFKMQWQCLRPLWDDRALRMYAEFLIVTNFLTRYVPRRFLHYSFGLFALSLNYGAALVYKTQKAGLFT